MARPTSITPESILEAAREVFLERGILGTTAEVAERAGISEGSIFKRFPSKAHLFRAAMGDKFLIAPPWIDTVASRVGKGEIQENLFALGMDIVAHFRELMPFIMMSWSNPAPNGLPEGMSQPNPPPLRAMKAMTGYFEAEMRTGRLRRVDPEVLARTFLGALHTFVFFEVLHRANEELPLAAETYLRGLVNILWQGVDPASSTAKRHE